MASASIIERIIKTVRRTASAPVSPSPQRFGWFICLHLLNACVSTFHLLCVHLNRQNTYVYIFVPILIPSIRLLFWKNIHT